MVLRNLITTAGTLAAAWAWTKAISVLQKREKITADTSRKIIHLTAAPVMMLTWPLYAPVWHSRIVAAVVPLSFAVRMIRSDKSDDLCKSVSRSGDHKESRSGPGSYCLVVGGLILFFWRKCPLTYTALGMMVAGDCFANMVGSTVKSPRWPIPKSSKTVAGSIGFVLAGTCATKGFLQFAEVAQVCITPVAWSKAFTVACICAASELLPVQDNVSVPLTALVGAKLIF